MTELEQPRHLFTALVEQSEQQTALINALDARLQTRRQLAPTTAPQDRQARPRTNGWPTT